jgi:hypothetical protein
MTTVLPRPLELGEAPTWSSDAPGVAIRGRNWFARHDGVTAFLVYLAISVFWYRSVVAHPGSNCACGLSLDPGDNADFVWWFAWFVHALGHGLPLMHPTVIWTPTGINLAGTTASLLLAVVAAPFTLIWGPVVSYNLLMILAPVLSGWAANRLCRHITGAPWPSLLAGATYGFSTYEIAHLVGHPQMVMMFGPPLAALSVLRLFDGTVSSRRFVIELSLLLIVQIFLSVEVLFTMTVVGALALGAGWATGTAGQRRALVAKLPVLAIPCVIAALASSWYMLQVLSAPAYAAGAGQLYPTDALSFFIPMSYTWLGGAGLAHISALFPGGPNETNAYIGIPLLLICGRYLITRRHTLTAKILGILMALIALWIVGPILYLAGRPTLRLPYEFLDRLPLLSETMQGRIAVYLALVAAVALAVWLATPRTRPLLAWLCGGLALLAVLPNLVTADPHNVGTWTNPTFFRTPMYKRYLKPGETILPIVWGYMSESYMWQAEDNFSWNMANGYWVFEPPSSWSSKVTDHLWFDTPKSGDGPLLRSLLIRRHVDDVVVQDSYLAQWQPTLRAARLRVSASAGGVTVYHVPASWRRAASAS